MSSVCLQPAEKLSDQFEILKYRVRNLLNGSIPTGGPIVAFTSCKAGEGVSSVAANFAAASTDQGEKHVLLMDCNLHKPSLSGLLDLKKQPRKQTPEPERREDFEAVWKVIHTGQNLDLLVTQKTKTTTAAVFSKGWFADLISEAHTQYDLIVLDCPPLLEDGSASYLSAKAHGVVLVVEAERVRREVIQRSISLLEDSGAKILGVVLNKRQYPIPEFIYKML